MNRALEFIIGSAAASLLSLPFGAAAEADETDWSRFVYGDMEVVSDANRSQLANLAVRLSNLEFTLTSFLPTGTASGRHKLTVVAFADPGEYKQFVPGGSSSSVPGYMIPHDDESIIVLNMEESPYRRIVLQHEFVHYWAQKYLPRLPTWINEGLADYFSTMEVTEHFNQGGKAGIVVELGRPVALRVDTLKFARELMTPEKMTRYSYAGRRHLGGADLNLLYAQAWLTVHYMLVTDMGQSLSRYVELIRNRQDPYEAFQAVIPLSDAEFDATLRRHFKTRGGRYFQATIEGTPLMRLDEKSVLSGAQVHCYLGKICERSQDEYIAKAKKYYHAAVEADSSLARAWVGLGDIANMEERSESAIEYYRRAIAADENSFEAHLNLGRVLLGNLATVAEAENEFRRALEIEPTDPRALGFFAWSQIPVDPAKGLQAISPVLAQLPWDDRFTAVYIVLLYRAGLLEAADAALVEFEVWGSEALLNWVAAERDQANGDG